jgi:hypothetical protein
MTKRRRLLLVTLGLVIMAVAGIAVVVFLTGSKHRIKLRMVNEVRRGMSVKDVERIFGPAKDAVVAQGCITRQSWASQPDEGWIVEVFFDERERVNQVMVMDLGNDLVRQQSVIDRLCRWLGF